MKKEELERIERLFVVMKDSNDWFEKIVCGACDINYLSQKECDFLIRAFYQ